MHEGDKIIYTHDYYTDLIKGETYTLRWWSDDYITLKERSVFRVYSSLYFITQLEYRRIKLLKIKEKICIKGIQ